MSKTRWRPTVHTAVLIGTALLAISGCTKKSDLEVVEVFGTVTYGGEPIERGQIRFVPRPGTKGPTSFRNKDAIGVLFWAAKSMPISPPIEVPTQCRRSTPVRAIRTAMSAAY